MKGLINKVIYGDCLEIMEQIDDCSVDMILCDLPYGMTNNRWDSEIPLDRLWDQCERIIKQNRAMVFTASNPFTASLIVSNKKLFRYEWIWQKTVGSNQMNTSFGPLKAHESVLIFSKGRPLYNPQLTEGKPYTQERSGFDRGTYGEQEGWKTENNGTRHPKSVVVIANPRIKGGYPTQKPVALFKYFVLTYSNEGDVVLDCTCGSGTTAEACINTGRKFICIDNNRDAVNRTRRRIETLLPGGQRKGN